MPLVLSVVTIPFIPASLPTYLQSAHGNGQVVPRVNDVLTLSRYLLSVTQGSSEGDIQGTTLS